MSRPEDAGWGGLLWVVGAPSAWLLAQLGSPPPTGLLWLPWPLASLEPVPASSHRSHIQSAAPRLGPGIQGSPVFTGTLKTPVLLEGPMTFLPTTYSLRAPCCCSCCCPSPCPWATSLAQKADLVSALRARLCFSPLANLPWFGILSIGDKG